MNAQKRGDIEINPRYRKIIRSMLMNNFILNLNNVVLNSDVDQFPEERTNSPFDDGLSVVGFCG